MYARHALAVAQADEATAAAAAASGTRAARPATLAAAFAPGAAAAPATESDDGELYGSPDGADSGDSSLDEGSADEGASIASELEAGGGAELELVLLPPVQVAPVKALRGVVQELQRLGGHAGKYSTEEELLAPPGFSGPAASVYTATALGLGFNCEGVLANDAFSALRRTEKASMLFPGGVDAYRSQRRCFRPVSAIVSRAHTAPADTPFPPLHILNVIEQRSANDWDRDRSLVVGEQHMWPRPAGSGHSSARAAIDRLALRSRPDTTLSLAFVLDEVLSDDSLFAGPHAPNATAIPAGDAGAKKVCDVTWKALLAAVAPRHNAQTLWIAHHRLQAPFSLMPPGKVRTQALAQGWANETNKEPWQKKQKAAAAAATEKREGRD